MALPTFQNAWLDDAEQNEHEGYAQETGANLLAAIVHRDAPALVNVLQGIPGPVGDLEMLGLLGINEARAAARALLDQGFDLLRPGVLAGGPDDYREEVMGTVRVIAVAGLNAPRGERLTGWLADLLVERSTDLALTDAVLDGEDAATLRAVVQALEARVLRAVLPTPAVPAPRDRL